MFDTNPLQITGSTKCIMEPTVPSREPRLVKQSPSRMIRYIICLILFEYFVKHLMFQVVVHGFIESDSYSPLLNISVIPQVTYRLAPAIWKKMYNYDPNWYGGHRNQEGSARTNRVNTSLVMLAVIGLILNMTRTRENSWLEGTGGDQKNAQVDHKGEVCSSVRSSIKQ